MHHSDDDIVVDGDDQRGDGEASDYPVTASPFTTEDTRRAEREEYYEDDMEWPEDIPIPSH